MTPSTGLVLGFLGVLGLLIGSFLNVVIYRLPIMMERDWKANCAEMSGKEPEAAPPYNLSVPRSRCQTCGHQIRWYENVPVLSYVLLRGKCSSCATSISIRYPIVELWTGGMFVLAGVHYGASPVTLAWAAFAALLIAQFLIDFDTQFLPDELNYPLLWLGLGAAALGWTVPVASAVWGAIWGYLSLWLVYHAYRLATGEVGMGYGDFKLLAALGAWFGAHHLIAIILLSSLVGSVIGLTLIVIGKLASIKIPIPFGPFLAGAGLLQLALGPGRLAQWVPFAFPLGA